MSSKTIYYCDCCGKEQENKNLLEVGVNRGPWRVYTYNPYYENVAVCHSCFSNHWPWLYKLATKSISVE